MSNDLMEKHVDINKQEVLEPGAEQTRNQKLFVPKTDIYESKDHLLLLAEMPGVSQDNIDVTLEQNVLTIYGRVDAPEFEGYSPAYTEYGIGDYRRVFALSNEIDREGIQASVKNGVLKLVLPKSREVLPKKITVQSE